MTTANTSIAWIGTLNNYSEQDVTNWRKFIGEHCSYGIWQREVGEQGTPHIQAYICLLRKQRLSFLKKRCSSRWHWEIRRGTHAEAKEYCSKEDTRAQGTEPEESGVEPAQGSRTDLAEFTRRIIDGACDRELLDEFPSAFLLHSARIARIRGVMRPRAEYRAPEVVIYYGDTDTGKSRAVFEEIGESNYWKAIPGSSKWFDGYENQSLVWFDDYRGELPFGTLLNITDGFGTTAEVKGGTCWFKPEKIWFTANDHPEQWYEYSSKNPWDAFKRRITKIVKFTKDGPVVEFDKEE